METGRELFNKFLRGEPLSRPAFVPLVQGLVARVGGMPLETLTSDPTLWANSLMKTADLFGFDGVVFGFDFSLMAEACGCKISWKNDRPVVSSPSTGLCETPEESGRMKHALEAARRVFEVCRHERACVAALTGPVTLASQLFGEEEGSKRIAEVKQLMVRIVEAFCQTSPDLMVFIEGSPLGLASLDMSHRRVYNTLRNIVSYYNIPAALYLQGYRPQDLARFSRLNMNVYIPGPSLDNDLPPLSELWDLSADALGLGLGLSLYDLEKARKIINTGLERGGRGFFFTSLGPVTRDVNLEMLHQLTKAVRKVRL